MTTADFMAQGALDLATRRAAEVAARGTLIDPRMMQALRERRALSPGRLSAPAPVSDLSIASDDWRLSDRQLRSLKPRVILDANTSALSLLISVTEEARSADDGREIGAPILATAVRLLSYAGERFAAAGLVATPDEVEAVVRAKTQETLAQLWQAMSHAIDAAATEKYEQTAAELRAELDAERAQVTAGLDAAQAEASQARRDLEAAQQRHAQDRTRLEGENAELRQALNKLRYDSEKAARRAAEDLADLPRWQRLVGDLERQVLALQEEKKDLAGQFLAREAELLAELDILTRPEVPPMNPVTALERSSYAVYCRAALGRPELNRDTAPLTPELLRGWRAAYPDEAAMRGQLRAVVRR